MSEIITLDCNACKSEQAMQATKVSRFSGIVRLIGYIFVVPSVYIVIMNIVKMFRVAWSISSAAGTVTGAEETAVKIAVGGCVIMVIIFLVTGLIGGIFFMKKKVFKCDKCGYIIDRA
jgi:hypothetical protein